MAEYNLGESNTTSLLPRRQKSTIDPSKNALSSGLKDIASMAASGAQFGPWGAAAGAAAAIGKTAVNYFKDKKEVLKETDEFDDAHANATANYKDSSKSRLNKKAALDDETLTRNILMGKEGGTLGFTMDLIRQNREDRNAKRKGVDMHRSGGSVNVIAKGVLHEEKNKIGDKGIPIVTKDGKKKFAEIEKNELVLHTDVAAEIERLTKLHKANPTDKDILKQLGELMKDQIVNNTVDKQGELL